MKTEVQSNAVDPALEAALKGCGKGEFLIARDGTWFHEGSPIERHALVKLFSTVLRREEDGSHWLVTPVERVPIAVQDAPFIAVEMSSKGCDRDQVVALRTNVDDWIELDKEHSIRVVKDPRTGEPFPYVEVRNGLIARLNRSVFYQLVAIAELQGSEMGVWSNGLFHSLGSVE